MAVAYPTSPAFSLPVSRRLDFATEIAAGRNGVEQRTMTHAGRESWELAYPRLTLTERDTLLSFHAARKGSYAQDIDFQFGAEAQNLLKWSYDLTQSSAWAAANGASISGPHTVDFAGGTGDAYQEYVVSVLPGDTYTFSAQLSGTGVCHIGLLGKGTSDEQSGNVAAVLTGSPTWYSVTYTFLGTHTSVLPLIMGPCTSVTVDAAQLAHGSGISSYVPTQSTPVDGIYHGCYLSDDTLSFTEAEPTVYGGTVKLAQVVRAVDAGSLPTDFPTLNGGRPMQRPYTHGNAWDTTAMQTEGGRYVRYNRSGVLRSWTAGGSALTYAEALDIWSMFRLARGMYHLFAFTDPDSATRYTNCRFASDSLTWRMVESGAHDVQVQLVQVP